MGRLVFDSADPGLPNLPENDELSWSNYDDCLSNDEAASVSSSNQTQFDGSRRRRSSSLGVSQLFGDTDTGSAHDKQKHRKWSLPTKERTSSGTIPIPAPKILQPTDEHLEAAMTPNDGVSPTNSTHIQLEQRKRPKRRRRRGRRSRKYANSRVKKERAGWEPGIDIRTTKVVLNTPGSVVTICDYSKTRYRVTHMELHSTARDAEDDSASILPRKMFAEDEDDDHEDEERSEQFELAEALRSRPEWAKVRWINVNGLSWEAISCIGEFYGLHRLSIEDMVDVPQRTKADIYPQQLFVVLPLLKLVRTKAQTEARSGLSQKLATRLQLLEREQRELSSVRSRGSVRSSIDSSRWTLVEKIQNDRYVTKLADVSFDSLGPKKAKSRKMRNLQVRRPLNSKGLAVGVEQLSIYLTENNCVISFFEHSADEIERAILPRLATEYTLLRESCDASILFQSILDSTVDLLYPVITAYDRRLNELELDILTSPNIKHTQELHLMTNELATLKSRILPISNMINQLKEVTNFRRFISENSNLYMSDIFDHLISFIDEIESMSRTNENLINLIFNTLSVETNSAMKQLSLVTVVFLPLSFWAGYFGMNFKSFGNLEYNVSFYWKLTVPFTCVLLVLVMWTDIVKKLAETRKYLLRSVADYRLEKQEKAAIKSRLQRKKQRRSSQV